MLVLEITRLLTDDVHFLFLFYAIIGITLKFYAIQRLSTFLFLPLVIYFGNFFILHDYIQIRVSVASAFLLLSIIPLSQGKKGQGALCFLAAAFFHYSAIVLFLILFFNNKPLTTTWKLFLLSIVPVGVLLFFLHLDFVSFLPIPFFQEKAEMYQQLVDQGLFEETSLKSPFIWTKTAALFYILYYYDYIQERCPYLPLILKITGLSLISFFALLKCCVPKKHRRCSLEWFCLLRRLSNAFQPLRHILRLIQCPHICAPTFWRQRLPCRFLKTDQTRYRPFLKRLK